MADLLPSIILALMLITQILQWYGVYPKPWRKRKKK